MESIAEYLGTQSTLAKHCNFGSKDILEEISCWGESIYLLFSNSKVISETLCTPWKSSTVHFITET